MLFGQKAHPLNFDYGNKLSLDEQSVSIEGESFSARARCERVFDHCTRLRLENVNGGDRRRYSDGILESYREGHPATPRGGGESAIWEAGCRIELGPGRLRARFPSGAELATVAEGLGYNDGRLTLNFDVSGARGFYGFGERTGRFNKRGSSFDFWNVDVVFALPHSYARDDYDPAYVAIPLVILRAGQRFLGAYFDNPGRTVIDVEEIRTGQLIYQSMTGDTDVYFIDGPGLRDVVRRFTKLTGRAELPPLWSLGFHQCRWGYEKESDLLDLQRNFEAFDIPVSALWYDIDYMDGYRVFTWDREDFPDPPRLNQQLKAAGIHTVAIFDPGVKLDPGYPVYDSGKREEVFCKAASGRDYVGQVWPGDTVFPDFSLAAVRDWWAERMAAFVRDSGLDGAWLDMNDPATGYSAAEDMLFENGAAPHDAYHNQYGHFMAKASRQAFDRLDPDGRPFLLTRSAWTGSQRYTAIWTGDNASNWSHLRMAIPATLNLGLSGVAFNGPDVGGFMGNTTEELLIRWYQAGFLFPFFRNHSNEKTKDQEPWAFGPEAMAIIRATIRTRYRLLPYLYQCFFNHYLTGDPVLRPLLYEFDGVDFDDLDDQYLLGDGLMAAPILHGEGEGKPLVVNGGPGQQRHVALPAGWWFDLNRGAWIEGGRTIVYAAALDEVPLFARDGAIVPYYNGPLRNGLTVLDAVELHVFSRDRSAGMRYFIDDRRTRQYQRGDYTTAEITARVEADRLRVNIVESGGFAPDRVTFAPVLYGRQTDCEAEIMINGRPAQATLRADQRRWVCKRISVLAWRSGSV